MPGALSPGRSIARTLRHGERGTKFQGKAVYAEVSSYLTCPAKQGLDLNNRLGTRWKSKYQAAFST